MRASTKGFNKHHGGFQWHNVDELVLQLQGGIALPKPALAGDISSTERFISQASGALAEFAKESGERRAEIVDRGAVPALVNVLKTMGEVPRSLAALALAELVSDGGAATVHPIADAGAIPPLVAIIRQGAAANIGQGIEQGRQTSSGFSAAEVWAMADVRAAFYIDERGVRKTMADAMPRPVTIERCARALRGLALVPRAASAIGRCGAVKPLLQLMQRADSRVTRAACGNCLVSLSAEPDFRDAMGSVGVLTPFMAMLQPIISSGRAARLATLAKAKEVGGEGDGEVVDVNDPLRGGRGELDAKERLELERKGGALMASCAVRNLLFNPSNKNLFVDQGGIELLVGLLRQGQTRVAEKATSALIHLARSRAHREAMVRAGTIAAVQLHLDADIRKLRHAAFELIGMLGFAVQVHEMLDIMHPLMLMLSSSFASERILAAGVLGNLLRTDEHKVVAAQGCVLNPGINARDRRRVKEWKRKKARKQSKARLAAILRKYRISRADADERDQLAKWRPDYLMQMVFSDVERDALLTQFMLLDSTRSGTIDANDVGEIMTILGKAPRGRRKLAAFRSRVAALVDECDTDGLGMVPFNGLLRVIYIWDSRFCSAMRKCVRALPSLPGASQRAMRRRQQAAEEQAAKIQKEVEEEKKRAAARSSSGGELTGSDAADGAKEDDISSKERWNGRGLLARWGASDAQNGTVDCKFLKSGKQQAVRGELVISRPPLRFLHVRVHSCSDLACTESAGRNDVYCEVQWGAREHRVLGRTATVEDTLDPEWDGVSAPQACFRSQLPDSLGGFQLRVTVWDDDLGKAEFLGQLIIDAEKFMRPQLRPVSMKLDKIAGASRRRNRFVSGQIALSWRTEEPTGEGIIGLAPPSFEDFESTVNLGMPEADSNGAPDQQRGQKSSKASNEQETLPSGHARAREADAAEGLAPGTVIVTVPKRARPMQRIVVHLPGTSGRIAEAVVPEGKVEGMTFAWLPPKEVKRPPQYASALQVRKVARERLHRFALQIRAARRLAYGGQGYAETLAAMGGTRTEHPPAVNGVARRQAAEPEPRPRLYVEVRATTVENFDDVDDGDDIETLAQAAKSGGNAQGEELDVQATEAREVEMLCQSQLVSMVIIGESDANDKLDGAPGTGTRAPSEHDRPTAISWDDVVFECRMPHDLLSKGEICITLNDANMPKSRAMLGQVRLRGVELLRLSRDPCAYQLANRLGDVPPEDKHAPSRRMARPRVVPTAGADDNVDASRSGGTEGHDTSANDTIEASRAIAARVAAQAKRDRERRERQERHARRRREIARAEAKLAGEAAQRAQIERTAAAVTKHWRARLARLHALDLLGEVYAHVKLPNGASAYACRKPPYDLRNDMPIPSLQRSRDLPVEKMPGEEQDLDIIADVKSEVVNQEDGAHTIGDDGVNDTALVTVPRPPSSAPPAHVLQLEQGRKPVQEHVGGSTLDQMSEAQPVRPDFKSLLESDLFESFNGRDIDCFYDIFLKSAATSAGNSAARRVASEKRDWRTSGGTVAENPMKLAMLELGVAAEIEEVECLGLLNSLVQSSDLAPYTARQLRTMLSDIDADAVGFVCFEHFLRLVNFRRIERRSKRLKREREATTREARRRARLLEPPSDTDDEEEVKAKAAKDSALSASGTANSKASQKSTSKAKSQAKISATKGGKWYVAPIVAQHFTAEEVEEMRREFMAFDEDGSGTIDEQELKELMRAQGDHTITSAQVHQMMIRADEDGSGTIDFNEFVGMVKKRLLEDDVDAADDESDEYEYISEYTVEVDGNEEEYEMPRLLKRDFTRKQIMEYREKFRERDPHRTGEVSAHELFELVNEIAPAGLPVNEDEFTELVCQADSDHEGSLNFGQFMQMMKDLEGAMGSATRLGQLLGKKGRGTLRRCLACECCGAGPRPDPEELLIAEPRSQYRAERMASRQRELREQLEYDDNGSVTLLVDMLRSSIEMAKENALATLLELVLHDKCADLVMRAGGIQPLVDLKRNSRNEVEEELAAQVLDTISKLRYDWHNTVVDAELTEKERARMKERLDPYYVPAEIKMDFTEDDLEQLKALFMHVDEDNAKHIDAQETTTILRCLGWNSSYDHIEYMINEVDLDRSGTIDFKELAHLVLELREQHYNRPAAKMGRCLLMCAKLPFVLAVQCAKSTATFVMEDDAELTRVELINDVRRRIDRGEESWDEIMNSLSEADQQAVRDEGLSKWS